MDEYYNAVSVLPAPISEELGKLPFQVAPSVQEVRFRVGQPVLLTCGGQLFDSTKFLPSASCLKKIGADVLHQCFMQLCRHSVYAYEEELAQGFFTIQGGNRIGVAGTFVHGHFSTVTSLNLRIARWITCTLPPQVRTFISEGDGGLLVAGAPGSGKTTFLRTLIQYLSQKDEIVCVVDERGELMANESGASPVSQKIQCDVYTRCAKTDGINMALRCMNPRYIVCDELGTTSDAEAVTQGIASGIRFLASVHCDSPKALHSKPQLVQLLDTGAFSEAVFLEGRKTPGTVAQWVTLP